MISWQCRRHFPFSPYYQINNSSNKNNNNTHTYTIYTYIHIHRLVHTQLLVTYTFIHIHISLKWKVTESKFLVFWCWKDLSQQGRSGPEWEKNDMWLIKVDFNTYNEFYLFHTYTYSTPNFCFILKVQYYAKALSLPYVFQIIRTSYFVH